MQYNIANKLKEKGYNVLYFKPETLEDVFELMQSVGDASGKSKKAEKLITEYRSEINQIRSVTDKLPKVKVYFGPQFVVVSDKTGPSTFRMFKSEIIRSSK